MYLHKAFSIQFQSTLPRGSDICDSSAGQYGVKFQSTLPRGSDNDPNSFSFAFFNFNPHSHEGATHNQKQKHALIPISIHTPTRERLEKRIDRMRFEFISIHTPTRERRFIILSDRLKPILFQSTLPRGSDGIGWKIL